MSRYARSIHIALFAALAVAFAPKAALAETQTLRIATLAPENSTWGRIFKVWQRVVKKKTNEQVELDIYFNGIAGDEDAMVAKMRTGQLDGASLSAGGLSLIQRDVLVLQLPGVVNSWPLLDMVRGLIGKRVERNLEEEGFVVLGWGDVGIVRQMSKGFEVRSPQSLRGHRPAIWRNEPMGPILYSIVGEVVPVPTSIPELLPQLRSGAVDSVAAPSLIAEQLQWTPQLDHIGTIAIVTAIGATVIRKTKLEEQPADVRKVFEKLQRKAMSVQKNRVRKLDAKAYERLKRKMNVVEMSEADRVEWYRVWLKSVRRMRSGIFDRKLLDLVLEATGKG